MGLLTDMKCGDTCVNNAFAQAYSPDQAMYLIF